MSLFFYKSPGYRNGGFYPNIHQCLNIEESKLMFHHAIFCSPAVPFSVDVSSSFFRASRIFLIRSV